MNTSRAVGHALPGVAVGTAVTLHLHGPWLGDVQSSSLGNREATRVSGPSALGTHPLDSRESCGGVPWQCHGVAGWDRGVLGTGYPPPA